MSEQFIINGGKKLYGEVTVSGAKNAVLPVLAATLLSNKPSRIIDVPDLADVKSMTDIIENLGATVTKDGRDIIIDPSNMNCCNADESYTRKLRASVLVLGPLTGRFGQAHLAQPGGCAIGTRPIDLHLKGLEAMGAVVNIEGSFVNVNAPVLHGSRIYLDFPSVGATENLMMAAVLADGETILENVAEEPEIVDLAMCLNSMGAKVRGAGTSTIRIKGVEELDGACHQVIPDRIEAGSYLMSCAMAGGEITLHNVITDHIRPLIAKLRQCGCEINEGETDITIKSDGRVVASDVKTLPYPGFPTDLQAQFMALMTIATGSSVITETVFENRFMHAEELRRMGADIRISGQSAVVYGPAKLSGAHVKAMDLRAGAALINAGLAANGETILENVHYIDRGYENIIEKLTAIGADIKRVEKQI